MEPLHLMGLFCRNPGFDLAHVLNIDRVQRCKMKVTSQIHDEVLLEHRYDASSTELDYLCSKSAQSRESFGTEIESMQRNLAIYNSWDNIVHVLLQDRMRSLLDASMTWRTISRS